MNYRRGGAGGPGGEGSSAGGAQPLAAGRDERGSGADRGPPQGALAGRGLVGGRGGGRCGGVGGRRDGRGHVGGGEGGEVVAVDVDVGGRGAWLLRLVAVCGGEIRKQCVD